jgi:hypothetical protein
MNTVSGTEDRTWEDRPWEGPLDSFDVSRAAMFSKDMWRPLLQTPTGRSPRFTSTKIQPLVLTGQ